MIPPLRARWVGMALAAAALVIGREAAASKSYGQALANAGCRGAATDAGCTGQCRTCHTTCDGGGTDPFLTELGRAFRVPPPAPIPARPAAQIPGDIAAFLAVDHDTDGYTTGYELGCTTPYPRGGVAPGDPWVKGDIDECYANIDDCSPFASCENTVTVSDGLGSFSCGACQAGYAGDGKTCTNIDECASAPCAFDPNATCVDRVPHQANGQRYVCQCKVGYFGDPQPGSLCSSIDFCAKDYQDDPSLRIPDSAGTLLVRDLCSPLRACVSSEQGARCGACPAGYEELGPTLCSDLDECASANGGCDPRVSCTNVIGHRVCGACPAGFHGDGVSGCLDDDECDSGVCDAFGVCRNTTGGFSCSCPPGYVASQNACVDDDECGKTPCGAGQTCENVPGSHVCHCAAGMVWDGASCVVPGGCGAGKACGVGAICGVANGMPACLCAAGFAGRYPDCRPLSSFPGGAP